MLLSHFQRQLTSLSCMWVGRKPSEFMWLDKVDIWQYIFCQLAKFCLITTWDRFMTTVLLCLWGFFWFPMLNMSSADISLYFEETVTCDTILVILCIYVKWHDGRIINWWQMCLGCGLQSTPSEYLFIGQNWYKTIYVFCQSAKLLLITTWDRFMTAIFALSLDFWLPRAKYGLNFLCNLTRLSLMYTTSHSVHLHVSRFIQASLSKIQGHFKDFKKTFLQFSRTISLWEILI